MPSTPEPPSRIPRTPEAPRYGSLLDEYEPYAPRKSARVASRVQRVDVTPPPPERQVQKQKFSIASPPNTGKASSTSLISPPATSKTTTRKKDVSSFDGGFLDSKDPFTTTNTTSTSLNGMLATPAKTPTSKKSVIEAGSVASVSRNIFSSRSTAVNELMPSPKKKTKLTSGFEINSDVEEETSIQIFTDTKERIPQVDNSEDNPFYSSGKTTTSRQAVKTTNKRRKIKAQAGEVSEGDHVYGREGDSANGAVFTFRGKKMWRSFDEPEVEVDPVEAQLEAEVNRLVPAHLTKPLGTDFKGAWLFGEHPAKTATDSEEDVTTDIEEDGKATPKLKHKAAGNGLPSIPTIVHPTSSRVTRAHRASRVAGHLGEASDESSFRGGRGRSDDVGSFQGWRRTRSPMDGPGRGSPTKSSRARMATRSGGRG